MPREFEFTATSFLRIAVVEARRGHTDPGSYFPTVSAFIRELRSVHAERRRACAPLWASDRELAMETYASFRPRIAELQRLKRESLALELEAVSSDLSAAIDRSEFSWNLGMGPVVGTRQTYHVDTDPLRYFAMKQLETNLRSVHRLEAPNRNRMIGQLYVALEGQLPRHILRTDIQSFYESVPHQALLSRLRVVGGISRTTFDLIKSLLNEWAAIGGRDIGLPTGVGLSAYLGEVFARQLDEALVGHPSLHFYQRYVDDIVVVARSRLDRDALEALLTGSASSLGLTLNSGKTQRLDPDPPPPSGRDRLNISSPVDFLGYSITRLDGRPSVEMSSRSIARYKERLRLSFDRWGKTAFPNSGHEGLLLDRVRFLTSNTKLANSKGRAVTGIYFNYPHLDPMAQSLADLDGALSDLLDSYKSMLPPSLLKRLTSASFREGFEQRKFQRYNQHQLKRLVAVWRA